MQKIEQYMTHPTEAMRFLISQKINTFGIAFGGDTYKDDPDVSEYCKCHLDICDYFTIGQFIKKSLIDDVTLIVTQEGGYNLDHIAEITELFLNGLLINK